MHCFYIRICYFSVVTVLLLGVKIKISLPKVSNNLSSWLSMSAGAAYASGIEVKCKLIVFISAIFSSSLKSLWHSLQKVFITWLATVATQEVLKWVEFMKVSSKLGLKLHIWLRLSKAFTEGCKSFMRLVNHCEPILKHQRTQTQFNVQFNFELHFKNHFCLFLNNKWSH